MYIPILHAYAKKKKGTGVSSPLFSLLFFLHLCCLQKFIKSFSCIYAWRTLLTISPSHKSLWELLVLDGSLLDVVA